MESEALLLGNRDMMPLGTPDAYWERRSPCGVRTTDAGLPNIRLAVSGTPAGTRVELTPTVSYFGFFNPKPATLVTVHLPACTAGYWETRVVGG